MAPGEGGVWALAVTRNTLVSGSTDRTIRIWDLSTGRCTHVFGGHTSTVRCLAIVKPEWVDVEDEHGNVRKEKWPKRPLIVAGSRDHSLRVWALPRPNEPEYQFNCADEPDIDPANVRRFFTVHKYFRGLTRALRRTLTKTHSISCTLRVMNTPSVPLRRGGVHLFLAATTPWSAFGISSLELAGGYW